MENLYINFTIGELENSKEKSESKTSPDIEEKIAKKHEEFGACPECGGKHRYNTYAGQFASSRLTDCQQWRSLSMEKKLGKLMDVNGCTLCTSWVHSKENCNAKKKTCGYQSGNSTCNEAHHKYFHNSNHAYVVNNVRAVQNLSCEETHVVLLNMVAYRVSNKIDTVLFFDDGATVSIITHSLAKQLGLRGTRAREWVSLAGEEPELRETKWYTLKITMRLKIYLFLCNLIKLV